MRILVLFIILIVQNTFASIPNSKLESRHQAIIEKAIIDNCFYYNQIEEVSSQAEVIVIDQGIRDIDYVSVFVVRTWIDQGVFDDYRVTVKSHFGDFYDHESRNWGHYSISSVKCDLI